MTSPRYPGGAQGESAPERFARAVDALVGQVRADRSILAAVLCGSLSHDTVWEKSDVDLVLVTIDDRVVESTGVSLHAAGVNVHALLLSRSEFRRTVEGSLRNSFMHSFLAKGRLLYTHDDSIARLFDSLRELGERDTRVQLLRAATGALPAVYKARKFFVTRGDLEYTAIWILQAVWALARVEVIDARQLADREVLVQALRLNPAFFTKVYVDLLNVPKTDASVRAALDAVDAYLAERAPRLFAPVIEHLRDVGEARSCTEIENWFSRNLGVEGVTTACEYLADEGLIGKSEASRQLTRKSNVTVQELAFYALEPA